MLQLLLLHLCHRHVWSSEEDLEINMTNIQVMEYSSFITMIEVCGKGYQALSKAAAMEALRENTMFRSKCNGRLLQKYEWKNK